MIMKLNTYRLSSLEDPTDEQLHALMEQVAGGRPVKVLARQKENWSGECKR